MSATFSRRARRLVLALCCAMPMALAAPTTTTYAIHGPAAMTIWQSVDGPATEVIVFAFSNVSPREGNVPPPGPRVTFSITRALPINGILIQRRWYGDVALRPGEFALDGALAEGKLEATVLGRLEERSDQGVTIKNDVPGRLQLRWQATAPVATTTTSIVQQAATYSVTLQASGHGRLAQMSGTLSIAPLGEPLSLTAPGHLIAPTQGVVTITLP